MDKYGTWVLIMFLDNNHICQYEQFLEILSVSQ